MFKRLHDANAPTIPFTLNGMPAAAHAGDTVAAALLANGLLVTRRSPVSGESRGPYCMMGACFECLVTIDGVGNRQGCLVPIVEGMAIETGMGRRQLAAATP
jgi:aerobic-type carbon monoxide dehydrogenase small subunit (CoxS/CutS family)